MQAFYEVVKGVAPLAFYLMLLIGVALSIVEGFRRTEGK